MKDPEINPMNLTMNLSFSFVWRGVKFVLESEPPVSYWSVDDLRNSIYQIIVYKNEVTGKWFVATGIHNYDPESAVGATPEEALNGWYEAYYPESAVGATLKEAAETPGRTTGAPAPKNQEILAEFKTSFTIRLSEPDASRIRRALNIFYCGAEIPPDEVSAAHMDAHYAICRTHSFNAVCGVDKGGRISILRLVP